MRRTTMRATTAAVLMAAALTACAQGGGSSGGCMATLEFRDATYFGTSLVRNPPFDRSGRIPPSKLQRIGNAVIPPCNDTGTVPEIDGQREMPEAVGVARIYGVDPSVAVAVVPARTVYVRENATLPEWLYSASWIQRS